MAIDQSILKSNPTAVVNQINANEENARRALEQIADLESQPGTKGDPGEDGTVVVANPAGDDGEDLTRITIDGTNYNIPGDGTSQPVVIGEGGLEEVATHPSGTVIGNVTRTFFRLPSLGGERSSGRDLRDLPDTLAIQVNINGRTPRPWVVIPNNKEWSYIQYCWWYCIKSKRVIFQVCKYDMVHWLSDNS